MLVVIDAQTERMRRELRRGDKQVQGFERNVNRRLKGVDKAFDRMNKNASAALGTFRRGLGAAGAVFGIGLVASIDDVGIAIRDVVRDLGQLSDQARKVGVTAEQLQVLRFAAEQNGVAFQQTDVAIQRFSRRVAEADKGTGELVKILRENNIATRDFDGNLRPVNDVLRDFAELIRRTRDQQARLALAFKAFDTEGAQLVLALEDGKAGLDSYAKSAKELGIILDTETIEEMKELDRQFTVITTKLRAGFQRGVVTAVKNVDKLTAAFRSLAALPQFAGLVRLFEAMAASGGTVEVKISASDQRLIDLANRQGGQPGPVSPLAGTPTVPRINPLRDLTSRFELGTDRTDQRQEIDRVVESQKFEADQLGRTSEQQRIANELRTAGVDASSEQGREIVRLVSQIERERKALQQLGEIGDIVASNLQRAFDEFLDRGKINFKSFVDSAIKELLRLQFRMSVIQPLLNAFGGGGSSIGKLFGFAEGGSFRVGGAGGRDSQLVAFRASPNETVTVTTPQQERGRAGNVFVTVNASNTSSDQVAVKQQQIDLDTFIEVTINDRTVRQPGGGCGAAKFRAPARWREEVRDAELAGKSAAEAGGGGLSRDPAAIEQSRVRAANRCATASPTYDQGDQAHYV